MKQQGNDLHHSIRRHYQAVTLEGLDLPRRRVLLPIRVLRWLPIIQAALWLVGAVVLVSGLAWVRFGL